MKQAGCNDTWWKLAKDFIIYYLFIFETSSHSSYPQFHSTLATSSNCLLFEYWNYKHVPSWLAWNDCTTDFVLSIFLNFVFASVYVHHSPYMRWEAVLPPCWDRLSQFCLPTISSRLLHVPKVSLYSTVPAFHLDIKVQGLQMSATLTSFPSGFRDPIQVVRFAHQVFLTH